MKAAGKTRKIDMGKYGIYIAFLVILFGVAALTGGNSLKIKNVMTILRQVSVSGILSVGMSLILVTGGIDLSVGSVLALAGIVATNYAHPESNIPMALVVLIAAVIGILCGVVNGVLIAYVKAPAFIVTMGMMTAARGLTQLYSKGSPIINLSDTYRLFGTGMFLSIPIPVYIFALIVLIAFVILHKSVLGRYIYAVGGNEEAANASGIDPRKVKMFVYTFCGFCAAIAGIILAARTNAAAPTAGEGCELDAIAGAVIGGTSTAGGKGRILGTVIGIVMLGIISNGLDLLNVSSYTQKIIKGAIIVGAVCMDQFSNRSV